MTIEEIHIGDTVYVMNDNKVMMGLVKGIEALTDNSKNLKNPKDFILPNDCIVIITRLYQNNHPIQGINYRIEVGNYKSRFEFHSSKCFKTKQELLDSL